MLFWLKVLIVALMLAWFVWIALAVSKSEPHPSKPHRWKNSWPGNFCLDCGEADPLEDMERLVDCPDCFGGLLREPLSGQPTCQRCHGTGCVVLPFEETTCGGLPS